MAYQAQIKFDTETKCDFPARSCSFIHPSCAEATFAIVRPIGIARQTAVGGGSWACASGAKSRAPDAKAANASAAMDSVRAHLLSLSDIVLSSWDSSSSWGMEPLTGAPGQREAA